MHQKSATIIIFCLFLLLSFFILILAQVPFVAKVFDLFGGITKPIQSVVFSLTHGVSASDEIVILQNENISLRKLLVDQKKLLAENSALRDQFKTNKPTSVVLLPAKVIGAPGFIPGVAEANSLILDSGSESGIKKGDAVTVNNNLIGIIDRVSSSLAVVVPLQKMSRSFTAKTVETSTSGLVVSSQGGAVLMENIVMSEKIKKGDLVVTKGDIDEKGIGFAPDIIIGKIVSVDKKPSNLFQTAKIQSFIDLSKISTVFVLQNRQ